MILGRIMPILLMSGTVAVAATEVPKTVEKAQNAVRTILQRSEIQEFAQQLRTDMALGSKLPRPGNKAELEAFLREAAIGQHDRDVTLDHWEHPLRLEKANPKLLVLLSTGVNGERDACAGKDQTDPADDDICEEIELQPGAFR